LTCILCVYYRPTKPFPAIFILFTSGKEHSLKAVFVHTLRYVKEEALKQVNLVSFDGVKVHIMLRLALFVDTALPPFFQKVPDTITAGQVRWVLTIPAIWKVRGSCREQADLRFACRAFDLTPRYAFTG